MQIFEPQRYSATSQSHKFSVDSWNCHTVSLFQMTVDTDFLLLRLPVSLIGVTALYP